MKPGPRNVALGLGILAVLVLVLPVTNLLVGTPSGTVLTTAVPKDAEMAKASRVLEKSCASCHVPGVKPPFYAALPVASRVVARGIQNGLRELDLSRGFDPAAGPLVPEPMLAKIERKIVAGGMPPASYVALHWNARLGAERKAVVLDWVRKTRAEQAAPGVPEGLKSALLRPLPAKLAHDPAKAALGEKLYNDKRLSGDDTISCASCHDLSKGGTDREPVSGGIRGQKGGINAPTTLNAALQFKQFWDGRAATLEEQADGPPNNPVEMGGSWPMTTAKLEKDEAFAKKFKAVYPDGFNKKNVTEAIAEFERTLVTPDSRFDKYLKGDQAALDAGEKNGYKLFVDKGCASCHVGELLGGRSFEKMGRRADYFAARGKLTADDDGRYNVTKDEKDRHHFKVPTLRNVALTSPYFHDGSKKTLREAVDAMAVYQLGTPLGDKEARDVVKFLETLNGELGGKKL
jgi:cytochrome c peroxidase